MTSSTRRREAFEIYWGLGRDRSIPKLQAALRDLDWRVSLRTLYGWSSQSAWQEQIAERERLARAAADAEAIDELRQMHRRHARNGILLQQEAIKALGEIPAKKYTPAAARQSLIDGTRMELAARGALVPPDPQSDGSG